jgi:hypothetical protein
VAQPLGPSELLQFVDNNPLVGGCSSDPGGTWVPISTEGAPSPRSRHSAVWTGNEMIVWGGEDYSAGRRTLADGARYDARTDSWTPISSEGAPSPRAGHTATWTGTEMLVWRGENEGRGLADGGRYDPNLDRWSPMSLEFDEDSLAATDWSGPLLFDRVRAVYDPRRDIWMRLPDLPSGVRGSATLWTGSSLITWGDRGDTLGASRGPGTGALWNPTSNEWTVLPIEGAPPARGGHAVVWTGSEMLIWGGAAGYGSEFRTGGAFAPEVGRWEPITDDGAPEARVRMTAVWTGEEMIVWGGQRFQGRDFRILPGGGAYDPFTGHWRLMPPPRGGGALRHSAVWTGQEMIVWGGTLSTFDRTPDLGLVEAWT